MQRKARDQSGVSESFFRFVQRHLMNECKGRLFALILRELGRHEPAAFLAFVQSPSLGKTAVRALLNGEAQFVTEYFYTPGRRADLAVLLDGKEIFLIEVKEDDVAAPGNPEQFEAYVSYMDQVDDPPDFVHISRYSPLKALPRLNQLKAGGKVHDLRYRHLYEAAHRHEAASKVATPLSRMVREYLEDIGVDAYKQISLDKEHEALTFLVTQMAGFDDFHGLGRLHSASNVALGPDILRRLLGNTAVIGEWFYEANSSIMRQRPKCRFTVSRRYSTGDLKRAIALPDPDDDLATVERKGVREGTLWTFASASLQRSSSEEWLYATLGLYVTVSAAEREKAKVAPYVQFSWKGHEIYEESDDWCTTFPSEADLTGMLNGLLTAAHVRAREIVDCPASLRDMVIPDVRS